MRIKDGSPRGGRIRGKNFITQDSLRQSFPSINVEEIRNSVSRSLESATVGGHTGVQEEVLFDEQGLAFGTFRPNSLLHNLGVRTKDDIQAIAEKLGEGRNFDAHFEYDSATHVGKITYALKKHTEAQKLHIISHIHK